MTHVVVFVDSERSDPYINSVAHNVRSHSVKAVTFVHVRGFPGDTSPESTLPLSTRTMNTVLQGVSSLANSGEYIHEDGQTTKLDCSNGSVPASQVSAFYSLLHESVIEYRSKEIQYGELRAFLRDIKNAKDNYVIDVTGCRKRLLGDFVAVGLVDGVDEIRTFDILRPIDYDKPWTSLLHDLTSSSSKTFDYVGVLETRIMTQCSRAVFIRTPRFRHAFAYALIIAILGFLLTGYFGLESDVAKWINAFAQFATFAALFFVFFPPRTS